MPRKRKNFSGKLYLRLILFKPGCCGGRIRKFGVMPEWMVVIFFEGMLNVFIKSVLVFSETAIISLAF